MNWYYSFNGAQQGPVSEQQLMQLASAGTIDASTLVWREGLPEWQALSLAMPAALGTATLNAPQIGGYSVPEGQKDLVVQQMREGIAPNLAGAPKYAGFWIRLLARLLDGLMLWAVWKAVMLATGMTEPTLDMKPGQPPNSDEILAFYKALGPLIGMQTLLACVYEIVMVTKFGGTLGKMLLGLQIVTQDEGKVRVGRAIGRYFAYILSGMTCLIGYIIAGFDSEKRSLHDHICSTRVIYKRSVQDR